MKLALNNNVYLVNGAVYDCIYDLNTLQLYRFNKNVSDFIKAICSKAVSKDVYNEPQKVQLIRHLLKEGVLYDTDTNTPPMAVIEKNPTKKIEIAWLEITQFCNFQCIHCYEGAKAKFSMSFEDVINCIDLLCAQKIKHLHIIGGEPMIHPHIETILEHCFEKFETFSIYTNASVITPRICDRLKRLNATVFVSLNSDVEKDFEQVTCTKNMFQAVLNGIDMLRQFELDVVIKKVAMHGISVSPKYETFFGSFGGYPVLVGNANLSQYSDDMLKNKIITEKYFFGKLDAECVLINMQENYCFRNRLYIDVFGDMYPCAMERRIKYGNIFTVPFQSIYKSPARTATKDHVYDCQHCEYRYACNTCYVDTLSQDFYAKPWFCSYDPLKGVWQPFEEYVQRIKGSDSDNQISSK